MKIGTIAVLSTILLSVAAHAAGTPVKKYVRVDYVNGKARQTFSAERPAKLRDACDNLQPTSYATASYEIGAQMMYACEGSQDPDCVTVATGINCSDDIQVPVFDASACPDGFGIEAVASPYCADVTSQYVSSRMVFFELTAFDGSSMRKTFAALLENKLPNGKIDQSLDNFDTKNLNTTSARFSGGREGRLGEQAQVHTLVDFK